MNPSLFISHGAPNIILGDSFTKKNIKTFSDSLEKPKYIIVISAHWTTKDLKIINYEAKGLMYDFMDLKMNYIILNMKLIVTKKSL